MVRKWEEVNRAERTSAKAHGRRGCGGIWGTRSLSVGFRESVRRRKDERGWVQITKRLVGWW